jgi:adenine-specific DNA methylase
MTERDFDVAFVADLALREKQIQQNYRPIMAVHKWFARRPGTLFRALILSEFVKGPLRDEFYQGQSLKTLRVVDPCYRTKCLECSTEGMGVLVPSGALLS